MATAAASLRQKHAEETRRRIRHAAMELFAERGFEATTVDDIAARADVSARTFFRYFATKEGVLFDDAEARLRDLSRLVAERPSRESPFEAFVAALHQAMDELVGDPAVGQALRRLGPELHTLKAQRSVQSEALVQDILEALAPRAGTTPQDLGLRAMVAAVSACLEVAVRVWIERGADGPFKPILSEALAACTAAFSGRGRRR